MKLRPRWSENVLKDLVRKEKTERVRERFRALLLVAGGASCREASLALGHGEGYALRWVRRINTEGLAGVRDRPIPGQPKKLPTEKEAALLARIDGGPLPKDKVLRFRGLDIQRILQKEFRAVYSLDGVYALLRRLKRWPLNPKPAKTKSAKKPVAKAKAVPAAKAGKKAAKSVKKAGKPAKAAAPAKPSKVAKKSSVSRPAAAKKVAKPAVSRGAAKPKKKSARK
jgi:transposase